MSHHRSNTLVSKCKSGAFHIAIFTLISFLAVLSPCINSIADNSPTTPSHKEVQDILASIKYQDGEIKLKNGLATLKLPSNLTYLDSKDSEKVLVKLWGNPPQAGKVLGMIMPKDLGPANKDTWAVTATYGEDGYVKDGDAASINYDDLLKQMKQGAAEASKARVKAGYPSIALIGWATAPRYDSVAHKLFWAKELKFGDSEEHTLNYCIRILGRHGVLELNAIASLEQLPDIEKQIPAILAAVNFDDGNRYSDFDPQIDKVATYGLAALVAGGVAAKLGFFKLLMVALLAAKKFIIIGFVAAASFFKKFFGGGKKTVVSKTEDTTSTPSPPPSIN